MRQSTNPAKQTEEVIPPPRVITVCLLTYIPFTGGYWKDSMLVLKICIESIIFNTQEPVDLFIFDNGSCKEVVEYLSGLLTENKIQYLLLSDRNIGKTAAWNMLFGAVRSEYVVYSDSDVYFYPDWEKKHLEIFNTFENVGMVSGLSVRERSEIFTKSTVAYAQKDPSVDFKRGRFVKQEYLDDFRRSLGKDPLDYKTGFFKDMYDIRLKKGTVTAYAGANHFQFMSRTDTLRKFLPFPADKALGAEKVLDEKMDNALLIRLSTDERFVHHIGNSIAGDLWYGKISGNMVKKKKKIRLVTKIVSIPTVRKLLVKFYDFLSAQ